MCILIGKTNHTCRASNNHFSVTIEFAYFFKKCKNNKNEHKKIKYILRLNRLATVCQLILLSSFPTLK